jgi:hypothetical protein
MTKKPTGASTQGVQGVIPTTRFSAVAGLEQAAADARLQTDEGAALPELAEFHAPAPPAVDVVGKNLECHRRRHGHGDAYARGIIHHHRVRRPR